MLSDEDPGILLVPGEAEGEVVCCAEGLSFWGGVDPASGVIIDAHHPNRGMALAGRVVLMPGSRGSCSGSGVLLQLARSGKAPAALVFCGQEDILSLGALIAWRLFGAPVVVLRVSASIYRDLARAPRARIAADSLQFNDRIVPLSRIDPAALNLNQRDRQMLGGGDGPASQLAMEVLCLMAAAQGATELVDVSRAHIDGCILAHDANLDFAEAMQAMGARTCIPTTMNAISVDRDNWQTQGVPRDFGNRASRLADAYVAMGALPTFTCAPYLLEDVPAAEEAIGWSESNAVVYANSVLAAQTVKHPDYLDLFIAMTGRAPLTGVYLEEHRRPACEIDVQLPQSFDESLWPMLGWLAGAKSPNAIPLLTGLEAAQPTDDDLKALCAAFATTSSAPMLHLRGHTPEAELPPLRDAPRSEIGIADLVQVWSDFNTAAEQVDLVAIGSPHASLGECRRFAELLRGQQCHRQTRALVTVGRRVYAAAQAEGIITALLRSGVTVIPDLCWCSITEPLFPADTKVMLTNSGKYAHYATGLTGCDVRFGSLANCAEAAVAGGLPRRLPAWLAPASN